MSEQKVKKMDNKKFLILVPFLLVTFLISNFFNILSVRGVDEQADVTEVEKELESLEDKADKYKRMIDLSRQQQLTLQNQLKLMQMQEERFSDDVQSKEEEISENEKKINEVQSEIEKIKNNIQQNKEELGEIIRTYDRIDQEMAMEMLSNKGDLSEIFNRSAYLTQASKNIESALEEIQKEKLVLDKRQEELKSKNDELEQHKKELEEKVYYLNNEQQSKNMILEKTKGEESKYRDLLSRVEQQKMELLGGLDELSDSQRGEVNKILSKAKKPKSGLASTKWYYAQDDPKWAYNRIGLSSSLIKDYGCAVTSLAMVFTYYDEDITPGKLASQPIFYQDLIVWPEYWPKKGKLSLVSSKTHGGVDWSKIKNEVKDGNPVIVFVRASAGKGHYVVIHGMDKKGEYVVHDPLFGANIYLDTTKDLVSSIYGRSVFVDQALIYHD
jgi:peptidoglycan hydrolase CwlO-like protein/uncharacterized protein YvpB